MAIGTYLPRPEYPRPDRQRGCVHGVDWLNLNGAWEFRFDPERVGIERNGSRRAAHAGESRSRCHFAGNRSPPGARPTRPAMTTTSRVAFTAIRSRSIDLTIETRRDNEVGWYRRTFVIPATDAWRNKRTILTVGAADFFTDCWCNGHHVGRNEGGYIPFEFDVTDALEQRDGELIAAIVFRVEDPQENREQPVGKQWGWYSSVSGIWQTVFLEPRASTAIERFEITTDVEAGEAAFRIVTSGGSRCAVDITAPDGRQFSDSFAVNDGQAQGTISLQDAMLWDPTHPHLYHVQFTLRAGEETDVVHGYFGVRSLSTRPSDDPASPAALALNGEAIYIRGALYQSYFADGIYTATDLQVLKDDISYAKRFGFDLLRVHIKIDDPLLLYWADTLGILLLADFPNFGEGGDTPDGRRRYEETMRGAIARDFNHPSIIGWCLFNETWGFGGQDEIVKLINPKPPLALSSPCARAGDKAQQRALLQLG